MNAQDKTTPYYNIPEASETYTAGSVVSRMIDGLGFRYRWATEGLRSEDLSFQPTKESRTTEQTIDHILGLTQVILNSALHVDNGEPQPKMTFEQKRAKTLDNIQKASAIFLKATDLSKFTMVFVRNGKRTVYPFWNQINGPISDALWHVGQVVSHRRSSGNPFPKGVSVLQGKKFD
tara:strand:- start:29039 stop:29569 length:531 start_codon:yes stop_codon:yes gene_type:complete